MHYLQFTGKDDSGALLALTSHVLLLITVASGLKVDMQTPPKLGEDGRFFTFGAVDFFQTINEQFGLIEPLSAEYLLHQTALVLLAVIDEYQVLLPQSPAFIYLTG